MKRTDAKKRIRNNALLFRLISLALFLTLLLPELGIIANAVPLQRSATDTVSGSPSTGTSKTAADSGGITPAMPDTGINEAQTGLAAIMSRCGKYSKCTDDEKKCVYEYLNTAPSKEKATDELMERLEKEGYNLLDSSQIAKITAEGLFTYDEAVNLFESGNSFSRDRLVSHVKSLAPFFDIERLLENNLTANDVKDLHDSRVLTEKQLAVRKKYGDYVSEKAFGTAKKLILEGYPLKNVISALTVAAALGVEAEKVAVAGNSAAAVDSRKLNDAESGFIRLFAVNIDEVKKIVLSDSSKKAVKSRGYENELTIVMCRAEGLGNILYSYDSGSSSTTEPTPDNGVDAPVRIGINDTESISLNNGSVNYSETLVSIPGVNGLDLKLTIDYSSGIAGLEDMWYECSSTPGEGGITVYYTYYEFDVNGDCVFSDDCTAVFNDGTEYTEWEMEATELSYNPDGSSSICIIDYVEEDTIDTYFNSTTPTYNSSRNYIHAGWSFNIPSLDLYDSNEDGDYDCGYLYLPGKGVFGFNTDENGGTAFVFEEYPLDDMTLTAGFNLTFKDGTLYSFASDGLLTSVRDRYNNMITYTYGYGDSYISKITDTAGREVTFTYGNNLVTITAPDSTAVTLTRNTDGGLQKITWQNNTETCFAYSNQNAGFDFFTSTPEDCYITYCLLTGVTYSTGSQLTYSYESATTDLSDEGSREIFLVTERKLISENTQYGKMNLSYTGTHPVNTYPVTVAYNNGTSTKYIFNGSDLNTMQQFYNGTTLCRQTDMTYNAYKLPVTVTTTEYNGANERSVTESYTYDSKGNLLTRTSPKSDGTSNLYVTSYSYHSTYSLPLTVTYMQDATTPVTQTNTLSADSKSITAEAVRVGGVLSAKTEYTYDAHGNVTQKRVYTDLAANAYITTNYSYADNIPGRGYDGLYLTQVSVTGISDADGLPVNTAGTLSSSYKYDVMGRLTHSTDAAGNTTQYTYDSLGRTTCVTYPDNTTATNVYHNTDNDVSKTDRAGVTLRYNHNSIGLLQNITRTSDNTVLASYTYNNRGNVTEERNAAGAATSSVTTYTYDYLDRVTSKTIKNIAGITLYCENYTYNNVDTDDNYVIIKTIAGDTNAPDAVTKTYINKYGETVREGTPVSGTDTCSSVYSEYDHLGRKARDYYLAPNGNEVNIGVYSYDYAGNLVSTANAENNTCCVTYDAAGRKTSESDFKGNYTAYAYDALGRLLTQQSPLDSDGGAYSTVKYYYDNAGNVIKQAHSNHADNSTAPAFAVTEYQYDTNGNATDIITRTGTNTCQYVHYTYDARGNVTKMYNGLSVPFTASLPASAYQLTEYEYDAQGNLTELTDPLGQTETYTYDVNSYPITVTDRKGNQTRYTYNALGSVLTDAVYNGNTLLTQKTYTYTATGAVRSITEGTNSITYAYDGRGNVVSEAETGNLLKEYTYDSYGNKTQFRLTVNGIVKSTVNYTYDNMLRLCGVNENGDTTAYTYDANGNRATLTANGAGSTTSYAYNDANLVTALTNYIGSTVVSAYTYTYYTDGNQRTKTDIVNGKTTTYVYDGAGRLVSETERNTVTDALLNSYSYTYDAANNRATMTVAGEDVYTTTYTYDKNNRLLSESKASAQTTETNTNTVTATDASTGITVTTITTTTVITSYPQSASATVTAYTYDANGNMLTETKGNTVTAYTYNARNQQTGYSGAVITSYTYSPNGLRKSKHTATTFEHFFVWSDGNMVYEYDSNAQTSGTIYVYGINLISSRNSGGFDKFYIYNAHGDVVQIINGSGNIIHTYDYDAFGNEKNPSSTDTNYFRYCGQYFDVETGTYYLRARYYDPANGRFTSEDPIHAGLNWYTYCNNNPICYSDPLGLDAILINKPIDGDKTNIIEHMGAFFQDVNGDWWYFYFGAGGVSYDKVVLDDIYTSYDMIFEDLNSINDYLTSKKWIKKEFRSSVYIKGDFTASHEKALEYYTSLLDHKKDSNNEILYDKYNVIFNNCSQLTMELFFMGTLPSGKNVGEYVYFNDYGISALPSLNMDNMQHCFYNSATNINAYNEALENKKKRYNKNFLTRWFYYRYIQNIESIQ